ncbi:F-box protein [Cardamine amara subsp. amara]|uniref:F-box protein n=1 Tax=Cardamine amara subsp. amara TaxID=228776 RepID=A0ABD1BMR0_CARAN
MASLPQSPPPKSSTISTGRDPHCWSKLPLDLMLMVFEILGFADFERAKSVCSSWYSGSKQSKPNNKIPWMILFPEDKNYCLLTNPEDKEKLYKTQHLGDGFAKSVCLTTCRSWLLMHADYRDMEGNIIIFDEKHNLFILNLLTHERINLPAFKSYYHRLGCPILWIDEKTKDYLVIGKAGPGNLVSFKKGDNSWKRTKLPFSRFLDSLNLVYKDHKLYCLNYEKLHIFDFSGEIPLQVTIPGGLYITRPDCPWQLLLKMYRRKGDMVVTVRGDVLFVWRIRVCKTWAFKIFKMGSSKGTKWEKIISLGDESIILDLGITVLAKDVEGMTSNSIYFNANDLVDEYDENELFIFNIDTRKVERSLQFHFKKKDKSLQFVSSSVTISYARWFLPSFRQE